MDPGDDTLDLVDFITDVTDCLLIITIKITNKISTMRKWTTFAMFKTIRNLFNNLMNTTSGHKQATGQVVLMVLKKSCHA